MRLPNYIETLIFKTKIDVYHFWKSNHVPLLPYDDVQTDINRPRWFRQTTDTVNWITCRANHVQKTLHRTATGPRISKSWMNARDSTPWIGGLVWIWRSCGFKLWDSHLHIGRWLLYMFFVGLVQLCNLNNFKNALKLCIEMRIWCIGWKKKSPCWSINEFKLVFAINAMLKSPPEICNETPIVF